MTEAAPASVTGRRIGKSRRVSAFPRPQLRLVPARVAACGADSITPPDLPEEAVRRCLAERRRHHDRQKRERRKLQSPVHHLTPFLGLPQLCWTAVCGRTLGTAFRCCYPPARGFSSLGNHLPPSRDRSPRPGGCGHEKGPRERDP